MPAGLAIVFTVIAGVAGVVGVARAGVGAIRWWGRNRSRAAAAERVDRRLELKDSIEKNLPAKNQYGVRAEAIVRDVHRVDWYPERQEGRWWNPRSWWAISPWFRVELKDTYHRGIEAFIGIDYLLLDEQRKTWKRSYATTGDLKGYIVGRIPYDWIVRVDWDGDEYYSGPHIYCRFISPKGEPWEDVVAYYKQPDSDFLYSLHGYRQAKTRFRRARTALSELKARRALRRASRE